jgi:2-succinyl-6-hydroxy-2,4-cyclohexadiene-1-carboxylate synthase
MHLFLLPGFAGGPLDWKEFSNELAVLCPNIQVMALSYPEDESDLPNWLERFLAEVPQPYLLGGYSMGGRIALRALENSKNLPLALILFAAGFNEQEPQARSVRLAKDKEWAELLRQDAARFWREWYAQELFASLASVSTSRLNTWNERRNILFPEVLAKQMVENSPGKQPDLFPLLEALLGQQISLLYIAGEVDKKYSSLAESLKRRYQAITVRKIPAVGHVLPLEAPRTCAELVCDFLEKRKS